MTPDLPDVAAIRARVDAATEGPWSVYDRGVGYYIALDDGVGDRILPEGMRTDLGRRADAEFIAHARTDVPALLDALTAARAEVERLDREHEIAIDDANAVFLMTRAERDDLRAKVRAVEAERDDYRDNPRDEHHTMAEVYDYRMLYNAHAAEGWWAFDIPVVKSWRHSDGEECFGGGWFIVTATLRTGQVSNHYRAEHWDLFDVPEVEVAPEWDGHTPAVAADRLRAARIARGDS